MARGDFVNLDRNIDEIVAKTREVRATVKDVAEKGGDRARELLAEHSARDKNSRVSIEVKHVPNLAAPDWHVRLVVEGARSDAAALAIEFGRAGDRAGSDGRPVGEMQGLHVLGRAFDGLSI